MAEMYERNHCEESYDEVFHNDSDRIDKIPFWMTVLDDVYYQIFRKNLDRHSSKNKSSYKI